LAIEIDLLLKGLTDATQDIKKFAKTADSDLDFLKTSFKSLGGIAAAAFAGFSIKSFIDASIEAEKAVIGLQAAIGETGQEASARVKDFSSYAESIQDLTGVSDEAVLGQISFLKQLNATDEQAKEIVSTATNLSAALGTDLNGAVNQLAQTFSGTVSKSIVKLLPELNNLTKEQLRNGEAVRLLGERYPETAKQISGSLFVQFKVLAETTGNLAEEIGNLITQNSVFKDGLTLVIQSMRALIDLVKGENPLKRFSDGVQNAIIAVASFVSAVALLRTVPIVFATMTAAVELFSINLSLLSARVGVVNALKAGFFSLAASIDVAKLALNLFKAAATLGLTLLLDSLFTSIAQTDTLGDAFALVSKKLKLFGLEVANILTFFKSDTIKNSLEATRKEVEALKADPIRDLANETKKAKDEAKGLGAEFGKTAQQVLDDFNNLVKNVSKESLDPIGKIKLEESERLKIVKDALERQVVSVQQAADAESKIRVDSFKKTQEQIQKIANLSQGIIAESLKSPFGSADLAKLKNDIIEAGASSDVLEQVDINIIAGKSLGTLQTAFEGAKGAVDLVSKGFGFIADSFLPGIGGAVSQLVGLLAQGPEAVRKQISEFAKAIPVVLNSVLTAIPAITQALFDSLSTVVQSVFQNLGGIITSLLDNVGANLILFVENLPAILDNIVVGVADAVFTILDRVPDILVNLADRLALALQNFIEVGIPNLVNKLAEEAPRVITELVTNAPRLIAALVAALPQLIIAIQTQIPFLVATVTLEIIRNIPAIVSGFKDEFLKIPGEFAGYLRDAVQKVIGGLTNIGGNVGGFFQSIGFADGGTVKPGFNNDSLPARLSSRELVVDSTDSERLSQFLDRQESGDLQASLAQLAQAILARPVQASISIGEKEFASAILNINQKGFRTA
jgi:hypothetical protein